MINLYCFKRWYYEWGSKRAIYKFKAAEVAKLEPVEREAYEQSLKYYRDMKNVIDTAVEEGMEAVRADLNIKLKKSQKREEEERRQNVTDFFDIVSHDQIKPVRFGLTTTLWLYQCAHFRRIIGH